MIILFKALLGAGLLVGLHFLTKTRNYYLAHLALSCPLLSVFAHYFIGTERNAEALRQTLWFGMFALLPFLAYLVALYFTANRMRLPAALGFASAVWLVSATALTLAWQKL
jgi:uncharacterized membrane protein (GlpM family)